MRSGASNLPSSNVTKGPTHNEICQNYSRNLQIDPCNWKMFKIFEKSWGDAPKGYKL